MKQAQLEAPAQRIHLRSHFADVEVDPRDVVTFPEGIPGYEGRREFVIIDSEEFAPLKVLHAVNSQEPCFLAIDPKTVIENYRGELSEADRLRLGAADDSDLVWLAIVSVSDKGEVTANLRAPVVINAQRMIGRQVMPNNCVYPLHHVIAPSE